MLLKGVRNGARAAMIAVKRMGRAVVPGRSTADVINPERRALLNAAPRLALGLLGLHFLTRCGSPDDIETDTGTDTTSIPIPITLGEPTINWHKPGINLEVLPDGIRITGTLENDSQGYGWNLGMDVPASHPYLLVDVQDNTGSWGGVWGGDYMFGLEINSTPVRALNRDSNVEGFFRAGSGTLAFDLAGLSMSNISSLLVKTFAGTGIDLTIRNLRLSPSAEV
jgi:hypothetical protein